MNFVRAENETKSEDFKQDFIQRNYEDLARTLTRKCPYVTVKNFAET